MSTSYKNTAHSQRKIPVDYTKKGFNEIREDLQSFIKRNYPETYQDFSKSSFGAMMFDLVSYIGDQLHYYIDHNANEGNPYFSKEPENVYGWLNSLGTKVELSSKSIGYVAAYYAVPADTFGVGVDTDYLFTSRAGSMFKTSGGTVFMQSEDVAIGPLTCQVLGHKANSDGSKILYFLLKAMIPVESGIVEQFTFEVVGSPKFLKIEIPDTDILEITRVVDADGNEYTEAHSLPTEAALVPIIDISNKGSDSGNTRMIKKPIPRRFIVEKTLQKTFITFGNGSSSEETTNSMDDPGRLLKIAGKKSITAPRQDCTSILNSSGLGIAPSDTTLTITYTKNSNTNSNAAVGTVNQVVSPIITFKNEQQLDPVKVNYKIENVQVYNEDPINGYVTIPTTEELKYRYLGNYSAQVRAVTMQDYVTAVYSMPVTYGAVKRASIVRDTNDFRRNLNLYLISEGADGGLEAPSLLLKQNVKTWLNTMRMVSDSVDIFDAKILNLAIDVKVRIAVNANAQAVLSTIKQKLYKELMLIPPDVGQNFSVSEVRRILRQIPEVVDVANEGGVTVRNMVAGNKYSDYSYNISDNLSDDGGAIYVPDNTIWEIKYLDDITGTILR